MQEGEEAFLFAHTSENLTGCVRENTAHIKKGNGGRVSRVFPHEEKSKIYLNGYGTLGYYTLLEPYVNSPPSKKEDWLE